MFLILYEYSNKLPKTKFIYHYQYLWLTLYSIQSYCNVFMKKLPMKVLLYKWNGPIFCGIDMLFCVRRSLFPSQSRFGGFFHLRPDFVGGSAVKYMEWKSKLTGTDFAHVKHRWVREYQTQQRKIHNTIPLLG